MFGAESDDGFTTLRKGASENIAGKREREITPATPNASPSTVTPNKTMTATTIISTLKTKDVSNSIGLATNTDSPKTSSSVSAISLSVSTLSTNQVTNRNVVQKTTNKQTSVSDITKILQKTDASIVFTDEITDRNTGHHLVTRTSSRNDGKDFQITASMTTKTSQGDVSNNQSLRLKGRTNNSWRLPLIISVVTFAGVVVAAVTVFCIQKRRTAARKRSFTPNIRSQGQENPMYENLIDTEQEHGGDIPTLTLAVPNI